MKDRKIASLIRRLMSAAAVTLLVSAWSASVVGQTMQTKQVMQQKLTLSARLLAALVTSDWVALDRHSRALEAVTNQPGWDVMRLPEFNRQTTAFQRANQALIDAAGERDQRGALAAYNGLVASCVECHRYVARARFVSSRLDRGAPAP